MSGPLTFLPVVTREEFREDSKLYRRCKVGQKKLAKKYGSSEIAGEPMMKGWCQNNGNLNCLVPFIHNEV